MGTSPRRVSPRGAAVVGVAVLILLVAGCAGPAAEPPPPTATTSHNGVVFTGPYAAEFADSYDMTGVSDFARAALRDSELTDAEVAETKDRYVRCMAGYGITITNMRENGSHTAVGRDGAPDGDVERRGTECELSSGLMPVALLAAQLRSNPEHRPFEEIMTECLIRNGAVPASYTKEDYARDNETFAFPFLDERGEDTFDKCAETPLTFTAP
jgi:hypothetical protein